MPPSPNFPGGASWEQYYRLSGWGFVHGCNLVAGYDIHIDSIGQFLQSYGDCRVSEAMYLAMTEHYLHLGVEAPDHVDLSQGVRGVGQLVHWHVLLLILSRVQPLSRLDDLRALFQLTQEEVERIPRPPWAFDSHFHIDRSRHSWRLPSDASFKTVCSKNVPEEGYEVQLEGAVASFCHPETFPTPEEVDSLIDQGCFVFIGVHPKEELTEEGFVRLKQLPSHPKVRGL